MKMVSSEKGGVRLLDVWRPFKGRALFVLILFVVSAVVETLGIGSLMPFLDVVTGGHATGASWLDEFNIPREEGGRLLYVGSGMLIIYFMRSVIMLMREYYSTQFSNLLREHWSLKIFQNFLYGDMLALKGQKHGHFINTMVNEPIYAAKGMAAILDVIVSVLILGSILVFLLWLNWGVTAAAMAIVVLGAGCVWGLSSRFSENVGKARIQLNQQIAQQITEAVGGIRQIKVFSVENRVFADMAAQISLLMRKLNLFALVNASPKSVGDFLVVAIIVGALFVGKFLLHEDMGALLPEMGVFAVSFMKLFSLSSLVLSKRMEIATYWPSLRLVHERASQKRDERQEDGTAAVRFHRSLAAKDLSFSFSGAPVLDRVSFDISAGEVIGLAGRSGSGKSTLCDLLTKLLTPTSGSLEADGADLSGAGLHQWRSCIGYVSQDTFLFNASIIDNIRIAAPTASLEDVQEAARKADADTFIRRLSAGYDTVVGAGGVGLSGGQRQRIALARALVRKPSLLILDEATSALDMESEARVFEALRQGNRDMTILLVTHKLHTLKFADRILFLDQGRITEEGGFDELYAKGGAFRQLMESAGRDEESQS